ncbi:hypothetical protein BCR35DRAFT_354468 [Leucosporidium creatinivorum]|uniref:Uncharacterized protein n=1 Tax=Leucosporidium creatinivorum TaxID=106004 RepID=A0A1Y2EL23_9BASI|nr:hypothetical protein BCR35DRAFT_354468 [Leucosporidium creatinivorum]
MRSSIFVALAVAPLALAQFGMGEDGSPLGGYGSDALASCTTGDNAGCSDYVTEANKCYQIMVDGGTEEDAIACACDANSDFLPAFKTCAACVASASGGDSTSSQADNYASQFEDYCKQSTSESSSAGSSGSATATDDASSSSSSSSAGSSAGATSAGAQANATATTEVVGASPTGAGAREAAGVAGMVGLVFSAMVLVA